jgi:hypothetical protein
MDARRELSAIRRHYREYHQKVGESVIWYEFTPFANAASAGSFFDDVYDEGYQGIGGRKFASGVVIPVLMIQETEDQKRSIPEGRQPIEVVNLVSSLDDFRAAGVSDPYEYKRHLNDMFLYDGRYFTVTSYKVRGRLRDDVIIVVEGLEIYLYQEFPFDPDVTFTDIHSLPWPSTFANI